MRRLCLFLALLTVSPAFAWLPRSCVLKLQTLSEVVPETLFSATELSKFEKLFKSSAFPYKDASRAVFESYQKKRQALLPEKQRDVLRAVLASRTVWKQDVLADRSLIGPPYGFDAGFNYDRNQIYMQVPKAFEGTLIDYRLQAHEGEHALQLNSVKGTWGFFVFGQVCRHQIGDGRRGTLKWMSLTEFGALKGEYLLLSGFPPWVIDEFAEVIRTQFTKHSGHEQDAQDLLSSKKGFAEFLKTDRYQAQ